MKNIVLTGMRGAGKSTLAKIISKKLNKSLFDVDHEIEKLAQKKIPQIVEENGWEHFRNLEKQIVKKLSKNNDSIISLGGGSIIFEENYLALKDNSIIIYLHCSPQKSFQRIKNSNRPNLTLEADLLTELQNVYFERHPIYTKRSNIQLSRSNSLKKDSLKIIDMIQKY